jgi:predicted metalloprotease with PDZ domain
MDQMRPRLRLTAVAIAILFVASAALAQPPAVTMAFTVSMERPTAHYFHVVFRCEGLKGPTQDFKMPAWTPGYYRIMDYARNVVNFRAEDGTGAPLPWEKIAKNTWRVRTGLQSVVSVSYDVYAFTQSVADSYLDDARAFIAPAGILMHVAGQLQRPATVLVKPFQGWSRISTGLDPVAGQPNTFLAPDFDVLYDSPILAGNQEVVSFEVQGIRHDIAINNPGNLDRERLVGDLRKMIETSVALMGDIPYPHYTFLVIGPGGGGLEHLNSTALTLNPSTLTTPAGYRSWLAFVTHEYFHLFNVKRIRPVALGPFDYDRENYTDMLWMSEGFTVYYEYLILNRAGLFTRDDVFDGLRSIIARYENAPGHLFQSAAASSFDTWMLFFSRGENTANTTISYYDKGAALGLLLDLRIRHDSQNRRSLDDVMRTLYRTFYQEKQRGFTDAEFREVCEKAAGAPLAEFFDDYVPTVKDIDYRRYLAYAGLAVDVEPRPTSGAFLGAVTEDLGGSPVVSRVEWDSPASRAGLSAQDEIVALDGTRVTARTLGDALALRRPGDTIRVLVSRRGGTREIEVVLGERTERSFRITPLPAPTPLQTSILESWLRH